MKDLAYRARMERKAAHAQSAKERREREEAAARGIDWEWVERSRAAWRGETLDLMRLAELLRDEYRRGVSTGIDLVCRAGE